jgi:TonB family protein
MRILALVLLAFSSYFAYAVDACSILNPIEIAATLRGPGVVFSFQGKPTAENSSVCRYARISKAGTFEEDVQKFKLEVPLTLTVSFEENVCRSAIEAMKAQIQAQGSGPVVSDIGDLAGFARRFSDMFVFGLPFEDSLLVARGSNLLTLSLSLKAPVKAPDERRRQDLIFLAREALASNFDGSKVEKYDVAKRALADDRGAFEADPKNFGALLLAMGKLDEARTYNLRALSAHPDDVDALYRQGVMDWILSYQSRMQERAKLALKPYESLKDKIVCASLKEKNLSNIEEGIQSLNKALQVRPDYGDAMAYMNLMYRERADLRCDDSVERVADLKTADAWVDKALVSQQTNIGKTNTVYCLPIFLPPPSPPPPPPPPSATNPQRVRVSLGVSQGLLIKKVDAVYPTLARQARIQGTVLLQAEINKDGTVENLTLISGHPMLVPAAIEAVKQWVYKPYVLNGDPVAVETQIQVNFTLSNDQGVAQRR